MDEDGNGIAARVALLKTLSGLDLVEMSRVAGLKSEAHVGMLVRGTVTRPAPETLQRIARAFGVSLDWLISGTGKEPTAERIQRALARARKAA